LQQETGRYLGSQFMKKATEKIIAEMKNIERYAKETSLRSHLIETFDKLIQ
jgi:hypothetical protein